MLQAFKTVKIPWLIAGVSLLMAVALTIACWDINFWPTDAEVYYMPAAKEIPQLKHLSQIHLSLDTESIKWLHGKEYHVLAISLLQRLMNDSETLRPLLLLGVICIFFSSILIFAIARRLWGEGIGLLAWFLFSSSFWPYLYILFAKHQTQGLVFFLAALWLILSKPRAWSYVLAGAAMAVSVFSSTVSMIYMPFIAAALFFQSSWRWTSVFKAGGWVAIGFVLPVLYANYPDIIGNLKSYVEYVRISGEGNHFMYNQRVLAQWIPSFDLKDTRGGWVWIIKYFFLVMPILFTGYLASIGYLIAKHWNIRTAGMIILSLLPPVMAEIKGVAQYGANYFPALIGILMLICYAVKKIGDSALFSKNRALSPILLILALHVLWNGYVFFSDIYPSRMATTLISQEIERRGIKELATFRTHPLRRNIIDYLNPATLKSLRFSPIDSLIQAPAGYVLLPSVSTDNIYRGSNGEYTDFDEDLFLNQMVRQGKIADYAVASFKTLSSSLIWSQEEEILAYRYLVLNQFPGDMRGRAWLLDAAKIQADRAKFMPTQEDLFLFRNNVRNIGTQTKQMMFIGHQSAVDGHMRLKGVASRIFKMGSPSDQLRALIFKVDDNAPMWVPYSKHFISKPVDASTIAEDPRGLPVVFTFDPPIDLKPGTFSVVVYRTGPASDTNYYRIYADNLGRIEE